MNLKLSNITQGWPFLLGLVVGVYFIVLNIIGTDFAYFPGDLGDARFNMYILEHAHKFFTGNIDHYWSAPFMYPEKDVITYSDNLLGSAPIYSFFRILGYDLITSFQFWVITVVALNYSACYLFLKWLLKNRYAAVLGAFVFAFSMALQSQITHAQTFPRFFIPLAIWMLLLFAENFKPKYFLLSILFLVLQFYCGIYLGFMLSIPFFILFTIILIKDYKKILPLMKNRKWFVQMSLISISNLFLLSILMVPYIIRSFTTGSNYYHTVAPSIPTLKSYIFSHSDSLFWSGLSNIATDYTAYYDHMLFPGLISLLSLIIVFYIVLFKKNILSDTLPKYFNALIICGCITFIIFLRIDNYSLYAFVKLIPGFGAMRSISRIINIELLFFGIAVGLCFLLFFQKKTKLQPFIFILMLIVLVLDNYHVKSKNNKELKSIAIERTHNLKLKLKEVPSNGLFSYEPINWSDEFFVYQIDAMLVSQELGLKTVNAYTGSSPIAYHDFWNNLNESSRNKWFESVNFKPEKVYVIH